MQDRVKGAAREMEMVAEMVTAHDASEERKGALGVRLQKGAAHFVGLCKLADAQILSDLGIEIERLEAEILKSKQKELEELISHMVNMLYEVSP